MKDPDQTVSWRSQASDDLLERLTALEDPAEFDDRFAADPSTGLASAAFLFAAVKRRARLWCSLTAAGLLAGCGFYVAVPPAHQATVSVLLVDNSSESPDVVIQTDTALAQSTPVAAAVIRQLGLHETPGDFLSSYTVTAVTYQVLQIAVKGTSSTDAVNRASAIANQFLKFHAQYALNQQQQTQTELNQQVSQAQNEVNTITGQINAISPGSASEDPSTPGLSPHLRNLLQSKDAASNALGNVQGYASNTIASTKSSTEQVIKGSVVLDAALAKKVSLFTGPGLYALGGLLGGLALGLAIVIVGAVTSERLRRRDDIAFVAGAPVRLSVGPLRRRGLLSPGKAERRSRDLGRVVEHLRSAIPQGPGSRGPAGLAVVAVDNPKTAAEAVLALAASLAKQNQRVVVADLSAGTHAARRAGVSEPGIHPVNLEEVSVTIVVPGPHDVAPAGPLRGNGFPPGPATANGAATTEAGRLAAACANSHVVLSLVTLDPAFGGDHLAAWATDAVLMVTAGESTAVRIQAAGEMVRLAGTRKSSVIVVNADQQDESLGAVSTPYHPASI